MATCAPTTSVATSAKTKDKGRDFFSVMLLGKSGIGKSTTGNKLLLIDRLSSTEKPVGGHTAQEQQEAHIIPGGSSTAGLLNTATMHFEADIYRRTKNCQLLANTKEKVRVLDPPGFSQFGMASKHSLTDYQAYLAIFRKVLCIQHEHKVLFDRVLYFLPYRGVTEIADSSFIDELRVLYHFFGMVIFDSMVIVATQFHEVRYQRIGFDEKDERRTQEVFLYALRRISGSEESSQLHIRCPPILYIAKNETGANILKSLRDIKVHNKRGLYCKFIENVCSKCAVKFLFIQNAQGKNIPVAAHDRRFNQLLDQEDRSPKCHPFFIPKYSPFLREIGKTIEPVTAFFNGTEANIFGGEKCIRCASNPGTPGCLPVGEQSIVASEGKKLNVDVQHNCSSDIVSVIKQRDVQTLTQFELCVIL